MVLEYEIEVQKKVKFYFFPYFRLNLFFFPIFSIVLWTSLDSNPLTFRRVSLFLKITLVYA